jgi:hypothetical protein
VTSDIDQGLIILIDDSRNRSEDSKKVWADARFASWESDIARHIENYPVTLPRNTHARALQLDAKLSFLLVHVVSDSTASESSNSRSEKSALTAVGSTVPGERSDCRAKRAPNDGTVGGLGRLVFSGVGIHSLLA